MTPCRSVAALAGATAVLVEMLAACGAPSTRPIDPTDTGHTHEHCHEADAGETCHTHGHAADGHDGGVR